MVDLDRVWLDKAEENLAAAEDDLVDGRYNSSASRSYYACFQAAVYAMTRARIHPPGTTGRWGHDALAAAFAGQLIARRKLYPAELARVLPENYTLRVVADYGRVNVTELRASRAVARARRFLRAIREGSGE